MIPIHLVFNILPTYVDVIFSHVDIRLTQVLEENTQESTSTKKDKRFFIEDIDLLGDKESSQTSAQGNETGLGNKRVTRKGVNDAGSLLLRLD